MIRASTTWRTPRGYATILTAAAALAVPGAASAQISARPATLLFEDTGERAVTVRNEGSEPIQVRIFPADFDQSETGLHRFLEFGSHPRSCRGRLSVYPERLVIEPGEEGIARVKVEGAPATCWSVVYAEYRPASGGVVQTVRRIAVQIHGVASGVPLEASVRDVRVEGAHVRLAFDNLSDAPLRPQGRIEFRTPAGGVVGVSRIDGFGVLPGHARELAVPLPDDLPAGPLLAVPILDFGADWLAGGQTLFTHGG